MDGIESIEQNGHEDMMQASVMNPRADKAKSALSRLADK
jgi:hypothetical protein